MAAFNLPCEGWFLLTLWYLSKTSVPTSAVANQRLAITGGMWAPGFKVPFLPCPRHWCCLPTLPTPFPCFSQLCVTPSKTHACLPLVQSYCLSLPSISEHTAPPTSVANPASMTEEKQASPLPCSSIIWLKQMLFPAHGLCTLPSAHVANDVVQVSLFASLGRL